MDVSKVTLVVTDFGLSNMHKNSMLLEEIPPWCCIKNVKGDYVAWSNLSFMVIDKRISSAMLHKRFGYHHDGGGHVLFKLVTESERHTGWAMGKQGGPKFVIQW